MADPQTLHTGTTTRAKWERLGGSTGINRIAPPGRCKALVAAHYGIGKSAFFQSHPGAFIFNLDGSSTVCPGCPATLWPYVDSATGLIIGDDGRPCILTWELIQAKIEILKDLSLKSLPRPETIVFDTFTLLLPVLKDYVARRAQKQHFKEMHGPAGWDDVYTLIQTTITDLHRHGYGVIMAAHVVTETIKEGDISREVEELNVANGFYRNILGMFEWVGILNKEKVSKTVPDSRFPGTTKTTTEFRDAVFLYVNDPKLADTAKFRVPIKDKIEIPLGRGWAAFEKVYKAAAESVPLQPPQE